jgi:cysteinyl-tRNA synthetase
MKIELYNTLSGKKEVFKSLKEGAVNMYDCGPTVYDRAHIGNLRPYVFADTLRRTLEYAGYTVKQVINITDVGHLTSDADSGEDKMTKALVRENMPFTLAAMREIATKYMDMFVSDLSELNIESPAVFPRASEHIAEDIELIEELEKKGFVYTLSDGVYFDTAKFKGYGKLGNIDISALKTGARVAANSEKRNPTDFLVWKLDKQDNGQSIGWDSPWGKGFPGWHIECSAMSRKYLGQPFDIHTGGIDHIPVHHNNEIAQSEAAYGVPLAIYWLHNAFINLRESKMAKSAGGFITLDTLQSKSISPIAYRYWLLTAHYRSPADFTYEAVKAAQNALMRLMAAASGYPDGGTIDETYRERFQSFIGDDLDTPKALALIWDLIKDDKVSPADKRATILDFDRVLGLDIGAVPTRSIEEDAPAEVAALAEARQKAREEKDWKKADALRTEIESRGFEVLDTDKGASIKKKL